MSRSFQSLLATLKAMIRTYLSKIWGFLKRSPWSFWFAILVLNFSLFITDYLFTKDVSLLFPFKEFFLLDHFSEKVTWLFDRPTRDIWRFSIDFFLLLILIWTFIRLKKSISHRAVIWVVLTLYSLLFFYQVYESTLFRLYYRQADFLHDYFLIKNGFLIVVNEPFLLLIALIATTVYLTIGYLLFNILISHKIFPTLYKTYPIIFLASIMMLSVVVIGYDSSTASFKLITSQVKTNIKTSYLNRNNREIDFNKVKEANKEYRHYNLIEKPNLFLLFIESYGKKVIGQEAVNPSYSLSIKKADSLLSGNNFFVTSNLSIAPVSGGSSWISFSTAIYGFFIRHHTFFDYLVNHPDIESCLNINRWLQNQGYDGYFLSPFKPKNYYVPEEEYKRYYALPNWIGYEHFEDYKGHRYGWNLPPSDQYVLNYSYDFIKRDTSSPTSLFYMTKNSHYPFHSPLKLADDWRSLKVKVGERERYTEPTLFNYINAISFQIDYLSKFIIDEANESDIFVLIGDHQPPQIVDEGESFETPIHIISKDSSFIASFNRYGFSSNLGITKADRPMRHEGFLSMMIREMVRRYGSDTTNLPEYLPKGIE